MKLYEILVENVMSNSGGLGPWTQEQIDDAISNVQKTAVFKEMLTHFSFTSSARQLKNGTLQFDNPKNLELAHYMRCPLNISAKGGVRANRGSASRPEMHKLQGHEVPLDSTDLCKSYEAMLGKLLTYVKKAGRRKELETKRAPGDVEKVDRLQKVYKMANSGDGVFKTREEIELYLEALSIPISEVTIHPDLSIDVRKSNVKIGDTQKITSGRLPVTFNKIGGSFTCLIPLKTLEGCPNMVDGDYSVNCSITKIDRKIECKRLFWNSNRLKTLEGIHKFVKAEELHFAHLAKIPPPLLGLLFYKKLDVKNVWNGKHPYEKALGIIENFVNKDARSGKEKIYDCQAALIEADLGDFAKL